MGAERVEPIYQDRLLDLLLEPELPHPDGRAQLHLRAVVDDRSGRRDDLPIVGCWPSIRVYRQSALSDCASGHILHQGILPIVFDLLKKPGFFAGGAVQDRCLSKRQDGPGAIETTFPLFGFCLGRNSFRPGFVRCARRAS